jgi:hypothetical protein
MSALAAARLGYRCHILTREQDSPAAQVAHAVTLSDYSDPASLGTFAAAVDVISFEFENVSAEGLDLLASLRPVRPAPSVLRISQDRIEEKTFLNGAGVATAPWVPVASRAELADAGGPRDSALVRNVYDLHVLRPHYDPAEAAIMAQMIMLADAKVYGHQFPAYRDDPVGETLRAVAGLGEDDRFATAYAAFLRDMVYGEVPEFKAALATVTALSAHLKQSYDGGVNS